MFFQEHSAQVEGSTNLFTRVPSCLRVARSRSVLVRNHTKLITSQMTFTTIKSGCKICRSSFLLLLHPLCDELVLLCVSGQEQYSARSFSSRHPVILHGKHPITKLLITSEHCTLAFLSCHVHITGERNAIRAVTRGCVTC